MGPRPTGTDGTVTTGEAARTSRLFRSAAAATARETAPPPTPIEVTCTPFEPDCQGQHPLGLGDMAAFVPDEYASNSDPLIEAGEPDLSWVPVYRHGCAFGPENFQRVMGNLIKNPNFLTSWLFRADILLEAAASELSQHQDWSALEEQAPPPVIRHFALQTVVVRKLVPRNTTRDAPLNQTCLFYNRSQDGRQYSLVVYLPHVSSEAEVPFYHPAVRGLAYLHEWHPDDSVGTISVHYALFPGGVVSTKLQRTALNILSVLYKHGQGTVTGYVKRVQHDALVPQRRLQDRYQTLKERYARRLIDGWMECTDPTKHVFEDLCIASFLVELWADMYGDEPFPGFVDVGCGNGLLVHILNKEGYAGWGFDAKPRKSWSQYNTRQEPATGERTGAAENSLRQLVLLPTAARDADGAGDDDDASMIHDGRFPRGTFIISNHADELTPWTPLLAAMSECPFIAIPCCSHNFSGARFRAAPPRDKSKASSTYGSLVEWVDGIARDCGWDVEREMLRIPSTRNTALVGRRRVREYSAVDIDGIIAKNGGTRGYADNAFKLAHAAARSH